MSDEVPDRAYRSEEPRSRLQRLGDAACEAIKAHPEYREGDTLLVCIDDEHAGGLTMYGFSCDAEVFDSLIRHVRAVAEVNGVKVSVMGQNPRSN